MAQMHCPGTQYRITQPGELFAEDSASSAEVCALIRGQHDSLRLTDLHCTASQDEEHQQLKHYIEADFPQKRSQLPKKCQRYWNLQSQLAINDGLIMFGYCLMIPVKLQHSVLCQFHAAQQGSVRTKLRARQIVYWPGIDYDMNNIIVTCKQCHTKISSESSTLFHLYRFANSNYS